MTKLSNQSTSISVTTKKLGALKSSFINRLLRNVVFLFSLFISTNSSFAQSQIDNEENDPDMPGAFGKSKMSKEAFMLLREEDIARRRGIQRDEIFDPMLRINAIQRMNQQRSQWRGTSPINSLNALSVWTEIGPNPIPNGQVQSGSPLPVSGRTTAIAVHPANANIVYVGTAQGGVYRKW